LSGKICRACLSLSLSEVSSPLGGGQGGGSRLVESLLSVGIVLDDQGAGGVGAQPLPPRHGELGRKLEAAGALDGLDGDLKVGDGLLVGDGGVGQDEGANGDGARGRSRGGLGKDYLVKVRGHGHVGRVANHLVADVPLVVDRVLLGQVERARDDADAGVADREAAAKVLKVRPVVAVEALTDLGAHVGQVKGVVHGGLGPLAVGGGDLVAAVVARPKVVFELGAELVGHAVVLDKVAVLAVAVALGQRGRGDVLDDPVRVARPPVKRGDEGRARRNVGHGAREAILEDARGIDGGASQQSGGRRG
jgi:hypothetical protein